MPDVFSNDIVNALDPFMEVRFLPNNLNPPEHTRMRKVLNRWFSPGAVRRIEPQVLQRCRRADRRARAARASATSSPSSRIRFPTEMFLVTIGLPVEDGAKFTDWVEALFAGLLRRPGPDAGRRLRSPDYFQDAIADRKANPRDPEERLRLADAASGPGRRLAHRGRSAAHLHDAHDGGPGHHPGRARLHLPAPRRRRRAAPPAHRAPGTAAQGRRGVRPAVPAGHPGRPARHAGHRLPRAAR